MLSFKLPNLFVKNFFNSLETKIKIKKKFDSLGIKTNFCSSLGTQINFFNSLGVKNEIFNSLWMKNELLKV